MIITNKAGLPEAFVKAAERNERPMAENEIRVTSLLGGARAAILFRRHYDEIEVDASEMLWSIFGTATHKILEQTEEADDEFREERLKIKISNSYLTGKSDVYQGGMLIDWKTTSVYKFIYKDFDDWKKQLQMYGLLWHSYGFDVKGGKIVAMLKDHKKSEARRNGSYPQLPVQSVEWVFTQKDFDFIRTWAEERIKIIEALKDVPDEDLPLCTPEERWNAGDKYAVMKRGKKRAERVLNTMEEANQYMAAKGGDYIEKRTGEDKKCLDYCMARAFCPYARGLAR